MHGRYRARSWVSRLVIFVLALGSLWGSWSGGAAARGAPEPTSGGGSANGAAALVVPAGSARGWGYAEGGALGIGVVAEDQAVPRAMDGFARGVVGVAAGGFHSLILKEDGTVWATGANTAGQLGFFATARCGNYGLSCAVVAAQVPGLGGVAAVAAGSEFSLALKGDGTVWAWGSNDNGQLGVNPASTRCDPAESGSDSVCSLTPVRVGGLADVIAVAGGYRHAYALKRDGTVWSWGSNDSGQLGNGRSQYDAGGLPSSSTPVQVSALGTSVTAIAAGQGFGLAVKNDGTLWSWGSNDSGQLGNGAVSSDRQVAYCLCVATPAPVGGLTGVVAAAGGANHGLARTGDGTVWGWGDNGYGELGIGAANRTGCRCLPTPQRATGFSGASSIAAGSQFSLATKADGSAWGWGLNQNTQLGTGATALCKPATYERPCNLSPTPIDGLPGATLVSAGTLHGLATAAPAARLTLSTPFGGRIGSSPTGPVFPVGTTVTLTALPDPGFAFAGWTIDGATGNTSNPLQLTMATDHTVGATFQAGAPAPSPGTPPSPSAPPGTTYPLNLTIVGNGAVARDRGAGPYAPGTLVALTPQPGTGQAFIGWTVDGVFQGWARPFDLTMDARHDVTATFATPRAFPDAPGDPAGRVAVDELSARGIIRGQDGLLDPYAPTLRAQMAAIICRAIPSNAASGPGIGQTWDTEAHANAFPDQGPVDDALWGNVGTLNFYGVAKGYPDGGYGPTNPVLYQQVILFVSRAMVTKGYWQLQADNNPYPNLPRDTARAQEDRRYVATYVFYAGAVPDTTPGGAWDAWSQPATRVWFARAIYQALDSHFTVDRVP